MFQPIDKRGVDRSVGRMCNLYRMTKAADEVAQWFDAIESSSGANFADEVYPGYPGLVIAGGEVRSMVWGFPLQQTSKKTGKSLKPKPVNNARTDKLGTFFWRSSFEERRCLIPLTAWCEAEGKRGQMNRTWMSLSCNELFTVAGVWRDSEEWGASYSMVMTDAAGDAAHVHSRMPVIISGSDREQWEQGTPNEGLKLCKPYEGEIYIDRTKEPWRR